MPSARKRSAILFAAVLLALACLLGSAVAQEDSSLEGALERAKNAQVSSELLDRLMAAGYTYKVPAGDMAGFARTLAAAAEENLPVTPLVAKIEEGLAKRAPAAVIQNVLNQRLERFAYVRDLAAATLTRWGEAGEGVDVDTVERLSDTLAVGVDRDELAAFLAQAPASTLDQTASALEFMAALKQSGLASAVAGDLALAGLGSGYFQAPDWRLARAIAQAMRMGVDQGTVASVARSAILGEMSFDDAARNLGVTPGEIEEGPQFDQSALELSPELLAELGLSETDAAAEALAEVLADDDAASTGNTLLASNAASTKAASGSQTLYGVTVTDSGAASNGSQGSSSSPGNTADSSSNSGSSDSAAGNGKSKNTGKDSGKDGSGGACADIDILSGTAFISSGTVSALLLGGGLVIAETGGDFTVYGLGPVWYWDSLSVARPALGDFVEARGYTVEVNGEILNLAMAITLGDATIQLRDPETGLPLWREAEACLVDGPAFEVAGTILSLSQGGEMTIAADGVNVTVSGLGPYALLIASGADLPGVGEYAEVAGHIGEIAGEVAYIAFTITADGQTITLRDPGTGRPLWDDLDLAQTGDPSADGLYVGTVSAREPGQKLVLDTATGSVTIEGCGPNSFWKEQGLTPPQVGDRISVATVQVNERLVAESITLSGVTVQLLDPDSGQPLWL